VAGLRQNAMLGGVLATWWSKTRDALEKRRERKEKRKMGGALPGLVWDERASLTKIDGHGDRSAEMVRQEKTQLPDTRV